MTTEMIFLEWDDRELKWIPILAKTFNAFSDALQKSEEIWNKLLPLQKKRKTFYMHIKNNIIILRKEINAYGK